MAWMGRSALAVAVWAGGTNSALAQPSVDAVAAHPRLERLSVFPFDVPSESRAAAVDAWWAVREELTKSKRFLLATENFLRKKNAYQARSSLEPADAIILGRLLDAQGLVTGYLRGEEFRFDVYEGRNGALLWSRSVPLTTSLPLAEQLKGLAVRVAREFEADVPYQGYLVRDLSTGMVLNKVQGRSLVLIQLPVGSGVSEGDEAEILRIRARSLEPLFQGGGESELLAQGQVVKIEGGVAEVKIDRQSSKWQPGEGDLVRFPRAIRRLKDLPVVGLAGAASSAELRGDEDTTAVWSVLGYVLSLAAFLVLAF
jgi:hypothetical protein